MNLKSSIPLIILALFVGILINIPPGCYPEKADPESIPESLPLATRSIRSSSLDLTEIWRFRTGKSNVLYPYSPPFLFAIEDKVIVPSYCDLGKNDNGCLTALSRNSGDVIWETSYKNPNFGTVIDSAHLDTNTNRLFLIYSKRVTAFDLQTGKQLWLSEALGGRIGFDFSYNQNSGQLSIDSTAPERILIEPSSGKVLAKEKMPFRGMTLFHDNTMLFNEYGFHGVNHTSQSMWKWERGDDAINWPSFIGENDLIALFGKATYYLARINYHTGEAVWVSPQVITSNYAIYENRVFVLRHDDLAMMDLEDGSVLGRIWFDRMLYEGGARTNSFMVMVSYPYLFTYFGDTQELVAFKFETK